MTIRMLLVDDHQLLREGLCALLSDEPEMEVIGEAADGDSAVRLAKELSPDVILMDITIGKASGIDVTRTIRAECPSVKIVALSVHDQEPFVTEMLEAGANGYVVKGSSFREVVEAVRVAMQGRTYLSPAITGDLITRLVHPEGTAPHGDFPALSPREREVLQLVAAGKSTKQTAQDLGISVRTVETHRRHIMEKLHVDSLPGLTKYAIREGMATLEA